MLDLSTPGPPARPPTPAGVTGHASGRTVRPARSAAAGDPVLCYPPVRVRAGRAVVLTQDEPTVALTNVQSAVGALTVRAVCSEAVGDLRLACAYGLRSGRSSMISTTEGHRLAPPRSARPVLVATRDRYEGIRVDLLQIRELQRFVVLAFSASGAALRWSGALVVETLGGARVDVPLDRPSAPGVLVALSAYAVDGQLVLRAERELILGSARDACLAYGFEHITWVDPWTPLA